MNKLNLEQLEERAKKLRISIMTMLYYAGSGHTGGSLSAIDILTVLYNNIMNHDPKNPNWMGRDRFVLSKGHIAPALYAILADNGYFDLKELRTLRKFGSILQGHPDMKKTPGLDVSTGSLGHGLSIATGMALGARSNNDTYRVYCMMGDGETQEGQIWEAAMAAGHYKLDNLCAVLDSNGLQIDGKVEDVMTIAPIKDKWLSFNWNVIEINGHNLKEIEKGFIKASEFKGKPTIILANTIKGKGISFIENQAGWHGKAPNKEELEAALVELRN